ncbi:uncharacterized protein EDB91DRAFT_1008627, partial [Suillus paluster]|uniref:uncharacterized protein n=1 Tax=Suillus paluster TaxID=48578 RepID=UPI001B87DFF8
LFQLRTGHAPLNKHLFRISRSPTATCQQCHKGTESVHHFLLTCPAYTRHQNVLRLELGTHAHHLKHLINDVKCLKSIFKCITHTRRFETVFGDV